MDVKEALVACSDKKLGVGITIWDMNTGKHLLHIPTSASPPHGLICLRNQYLVASQIHRPGSVAGGVIFTWPLNKTQAPLRNYTIEAIGPLSCTKDGVYLAGGAPSGNIYIWEVSSGRLLKNWRAHHKSLTCLTFSGDGSLLMSGSEDGMVVVWPMIILLDESDCGSLPSMLSFSTEHTASITGLLSASSSLTSVFVSSSLDGTCKVWDLIAGTLLKSRTFPISITAVVLDPTEKILFSGSADGRIFLNTIDVGLEEDPCGNSEEQQTMLNGHKGSITALIFGGLGLISSSEDCTACLWDVTNCVIIRRFNHPKGSITNLAVIPQLSLLPTRSHQKASNQFRASLLEKYYQSANSSKGTITLLPQYCSLEEQHSTSEYPSADSLNQQILDIERGSTLLAIQMKVETNIEKQVWATRMAKHMMELNKHLQTRLLDLMQRRVSQLPETEFPSINRRKKLKADSLPLDGEEQVQFSTTGH